MLLFAENVRIVWFTAPLADMLMCASAWSMETRVDVRIESVDDRRRPELAAPAATHGTMIDFAVVNGGFHDAERFVAFVRTWLDVHYTIERAAHGRLHVEWRAVPAAPAASV
jgi:hypothetical protein